MVSRGPTNLSQEPQGQSPPCPSSGSGDVVQGIGAGTSAHCSLPLRSTPHLPLSSHTLLASLPSGVQLVLLEGLWWQLISALVWVKTSLFHTFLKDIFVRCEFQFGSSS